MAKGYAIILLDVGDGDRYAEYARRATPIEELRRHGARNVRWSALDNAGIETVGDLSRRSAGASRPTSSWPTPTPRCRPC